MPPQLLTLQSKALIDHYLRKYPPQVSELAFTNLFAWRHSRPVHFEEFRDSLIIFAETGKGLSILGAPAGPVALAELLEEYGGQIVAIERFPKAKVPERESFQAEIRDDRDNADYVYRVADLASLRGRHFAKKRNHISRCLAENDCFYEEIGPENISDCLAMQDRWCSARDCGADPGLCGEYRAIVETLAHYGEFGLFGGAIRIAGTIEAFTIGETLGPGTAVCHFEKATAGIHGLGQLINQWFAQKSLSGHTFVNREQDLGIAGLRKAKESYYPDHLVEKVRIVMPGAGKAVLGNPQQCCRHGA
ncbi:DUF2156 domain-containing protein [Thiovibrio sp. JS02]